MVAAASKSGLLAAGQAGVCGQVAGMVNSLGSVGAGWWTGGQQSGLPGCDPYVLRRHRAGEVPGR